MAGEAHRRGSAALEFALLLPIWLAIVFGIVDVGYLFFRHAVLDASANLGCRAGAMVDPGDADQALHRVIHRATERMDEVLALFRVEPCDTCVVNARTVGAPPQRTLICEVTHRVDPIIGIFFGPVDVVSVQVARLEWQREAAP